MQDSRKDFGLTPERIAARYRAALQKRSLWESHWQECYDFAMPGRDGFSYGGRGEKRNDRLFDATALDAVEQLAASLLSQLTPPWSRWFGLRPGTDLTEDEKNILAPVLDAAAVRIQSHLDRSNFAVEMHQALLDLVTAGTASLCFEENTPGEFSAFRFTAVPLSEIVLEEGANGALNTIYRRFEINFATLQSRYHGVELPIDIMARAADNDDATFTILEAIIPDQTAFIYTALLENDSAPFLLAQTRIAQSPYINFRWLKSPGESYGRSPVMKALPDIKTANKVVELVLKNASIAVTGIWQADDDGVLNPANIKLLPGSIIPKAVGSAGLTPLGAPGRFDVSQLVLNDLRANIRRSLYADQLGPVTSARMTATEVMARSGEIARILGATYGRLQSELLTPLIMRAVALLKRRGEIPDIVIDGRTVELDYRSPLAQAQSQRDVQSILQWITGVNSLGGDAAQIIDTTALARWLGTSFGVPVHFMKTPNNEKDNA